MRLIETANPSLLSGCSVTHIGQTRVASDATLKELIEHLSLKLTTENLPEDELGTDMNINSVQMTQVTQQPSSTNRTVVHLMIEMLKPKSVRTSMIRPVVREEC